MAQSTAQPAARMQCTPPLPMAMASVPGILPTCPSSGVPIGLEQPLRQMVAPVAAARPPAAAFPGCAFFQSDVLLRALKVTHVFCCQ